MWTMVGDATADADVIDVPALRVASTMRRPGYDRVDLMKIDAEGSEYEIIDDLLGMDELPNQLLVEFHHRFADIATARIRRRIRALRHAGYRAFDVSETGREIGFVSRRRL